MQKGTFGNSEACEVLATILSKEENKKARRYVASTITEYCTFLKNIKFIKNQNEELSQRFALYELNSKLQFIKNGVNLTQEIKNFASNVLNSKYRIFCKLPKK